MGDKTHSPPSARDDSRRPRPEAAFAPLYGAAGAVLSRKGRWRSILAGHIAPKPHDLIVDFACGVGDLVLQLARLQPAARILAVDEDAEMIARAQARAAASNVAVSFVRAPAHDVSGLLRSVVATKAIVTLTDIHRPAEKMRQLELARGIIDPLGVLFVIDHGAQRTSLMRGLNNATRALRNAPAGDGRDMLTPLIRSAGFVAVEESLSWPTPSGSVSMFRARAT
jgi:SAM-dependent methyltransferase